MLKVLNVYLFLILGLALPAYAENPQDVLNQYVSELRRNPSDYTLREKIIRHAQTMKPAPAVPEEARKHMARGLAAIEEAEAEADYKDAIVEFEKVVNDAPWLGEGYRNLGIARDKAGQYDGAIRNLNLYLLTNPQDAGKAKDLIYKIEYRKEKAQRAAREAEEAKAHEERRHDEERLAKLRALESWSGIWKGAGSADMRWRLRISGNTINITYYDSYNYKTKVWGSNHSCPWGWQGTIAENLDLSLTESLPDSCSSTPRPPTMSWPVTGRISFDEKLIYINARYWDFNNGQWFGGKAILAPD